jgi:hypothetical protein
MRIIDLAFALILFIASAAVTAILMAVFIHHGLGVTPAVLRLDALIAAGLLGVAFVLAAISYSRKQ